MEKIQKITYKESLAERKTDFDTTFVIEPLMRGYANTLGTVLRRTLLSSITSVAPFAIKINNVQHEFETLPGVKEDVVTLIANIRKIRFTYKPELFEKENLARISFKATHDGDITASDINEPSGLEIVNKDQHICSLQKGTTLEFDLFLRVGRGYIDFEENKTIIQEYGPKLESKIKKGQFLAIDSDFSPVKNCAIHFEELNTSAKNVEERLKISVQTDGTLDAKSAMQQAATIIVAHFQIIGNIDALGTINLFEEARDKKEKTTKLNLPIEKLNLTIRSLNALRRANYNTIDELLKLSEDELSNIKNLGKKSVQDIIDKLVEWKTKHQDGDFSDDMVEEVDEQSIDKGDK
ncbi:DNA-directed RNA polymerase subunit alpha [Metamycoplasma arthritidis]|uniref:DNA-directed RNA polymerase subunit alpha n=1 Tax=Metamycoplasma arthritidis (strain 158L3-1) TaxID=243272 RepID=B3PMM1_META1|nr:DNA-directed RNA polymerase subunit alpha [Metamycoplasma arthritidis]ACF07273.1 DNA-directed RNA polymerase alpha subunit [Metamycoplasma arthritidis 158L3-1]VEU78796.1 DNA-directed RNA polymerase subunit alpha [Metamycoplasma arthritidis]